VLLLNEDAVVLCKHRAPVAIHVDQTLVTIAGKPVLVDPYPVGRGISRCPNTLLIGVKPCQRVLAVKDGYSNLLFIKGQRVCLDTLKGPTDGTPPGGAEYLVKSAGQEFVFQNP